MRARFREESGNATVTALGAIAITSAILTVLITLGIVYQGRSLAAAAAELAALSAADALAGGGSSHEACAIAREVAERHGTVLESCDASDFEAKTAVAVRVHLPLLGAQSLTEVARAGPAPAQPRVRPDYRESLTGIAPNGPAPLASSHYPNHGLVA